MENKEKIEVWYAGKNDNYSSYIIKKIKNSENLQLVKIIFSKPELEKALKIYEPAILILGGETNPKKALKELSEINKSYEGVKVIIIVNVEDEMFIVKALCNGAFDYFVRDMKVHDINSKILEVYNSRTPLNSVLKNNFKKTFETVNYAASAYELSPRESEILGLMIGGLTKKKMAETLSLSFHTIDSHLRKIYRKLGVNTKTQAVSKALKSS